MRKIKSILSFTFIAFTALQSCNDSKGTNDSKEKVADMPVSTKSTEAAAAFQEGLAFADDGNTQKARASFTKAIGLDSNLAIAYLYRSNTANTPKEFADDLAKAKAHLEGASDWEKWYYDFENTFLTGDYNSRLEIAEKIAKAYPDAARAQVDLGNTYIGGNKFSEARQAFEKAVELNPKWGGGFNALAISYLFNEPKDFKKAEDNALKAVALTPNATGAQIALGDCYRAENDMEKARDAYSKAITLDPASSGGYYKRGHANSFLGNYEDARKDYMEGAKHDDVKSNAMFNIANTYVYAGDTKAAMKYLMEASASLDSSADSQDKKTIAKINLLGSMANIALHTSDNAALSQAVTMMHPLSEQIGNDVGTNEAKLQEKGNMLYWDALVLAAGGNYDVAKAKAEEIKTTLDPIKDPLKLQQYEFVLGYISMKQKNYKDAVSHFEKTDPNSMYNKYCLAMANEAAGNKDKANAAYKEIANYNFNDIGYALVRNEVKKKVAP